MRKSFLICMSTLFLLSHCLTSYAETSKTITLKDGSILKGKVIALSDGFYTLETSNLGAISIAESEILSITAPNANQTSSDQFSETQKAQLKQQVEQLQGTILADEEITTEIENLVEDEEIKALLSDPSLLNDVMGFDQNKIQQNNSVQGLMNNPKIQNLMNKIQQKIPAQ